MNELRSEIIKAYCFLREHNQSISDLALDFMKNAALEALENPKQAPALPTAIKALERIVEEGGEGLTGEDARDFYDIAKRTLEQQQQEPVAQVSEIATDSITKEA